MQSLGKKEELLKLVRDTKLEAETSKCRVAELEAKLRDAISAGGGSGDGGVVDSEAAASATVRATADAQEEVAGLRERLDAAEAAAVSAAAAAAAVGHGRDPHHQPASRLGPSRDRRVRCVFVCVCARAMCVVHASVRACERASVCFCV